MEIEVQMGYNDQGSVLSTAVSLRVIILSAGSVMFSIRGFLLLVTAKCAETFWVCEG